MEKSNLNQLLDRIEGNISKSTVFREEEKPDPFDMKRWWYSMRLGNYKVEVTPVAHLFASPSFHLSVKSPKDEKVLVISHFENSPPEDYLNRVESLFWKMQEAETGREPEHITQAKKIEEQRQTQIRDFNTKYDAVAKKVLGSLD